MTKSILDSLNRIGDILCRISHDIKSISASVNPRAEARIEFYALISGKYRKVKQMQAKVTQKVNVSLKVLDAKGNDALVDGLPSWSLTDPALGNLVVAADGMSAEFNPAGPVGSLKIQVSGDADLGAGVVTIAGELDLDLLPGDAVTLALSGEAV